MALDPQAKMMMDGMAAMGISLYTAGQTAAEMREQMESRKMPAPVEPVMARTEDRTVPAADGYAIPIRIYWPTESAEARPVVVFFHGGGWVIGGIESHDATVRSLAAATDMVWVSVDYRMAPEHKFPVAAEDCYAATEWVARNAASIGADASRLAVAGDSAGGNLAAVVALVARDRPGPDIAFQLLIYPVTDFDTTTKSMRDNGEGYPFLTLDSMKFFYDQYVSEADRSDPLAAPLRSESLAGLPPALVITAEYDLLRDEGNAYARRMQESGVPTTLTCYAGMIHGFFSMPLVMDSAKAAQAQAARTLVRALS